jgi:hypothetical protein
VRNGNPIQDIHGKDTGEADPAVTVALHAYATGTAGEHEALTALAGARLVVPVVAMLNESHPAQPAESPGKSSPRNGGTGPEKKNAGSGTEKETEMALPTLVGNDGRTAVIAFTGTESVARWNPEARPVPFPASRVWEYAAAEAEAVVIDVAGPVALAIEGARLRALAAGKPVPLPHEDPDVRAQIAEVTSDFDLEAGPDGSDFAVALRSADPEQVRAIAQEITSRVRAQGRFRRGVAFRLISP